MSQIYNYLKCHFQAFDGGLCVVEFFFLTKNESIYFVYFKGKEFLSFYFFLLIIQKHEFLNLN